MKPSESAIALLMIVIFLFTTVVHEAYQDKRINRLEKDLNKPPLPLIGDSIKALKPYDKEYEDTVFEEGVQFGFFASQKGPTNFNDLLLKAYEIRAEAKKLTQQQREAKKKYE